jgi:hypothetical protein
MPSNGSITGYEQAAQLTVDLIDHSHTPNEISDVVLERLIEMSQEARISIWHEKTGIRVESLAALYRLYEIGAGYRRSRLYGEYDTGRVRRDDE